ncbi:hypothetical protein TJA_19880 [Thermus sp. LT1-2-5]|uniref:hypothetical protein n=1 Tax=Thermus sp. LT1-2-5 TaxID=3026935 RepID=UPI0030E8D047
MEPIRGWIKGRFPDLVALLVAMGFFLTLLELLLLGHTEGIQLLAPMVAGLGVLLAALGLLSPSLRMGAAVALLLLGGAGLLGLVEHMEEGLPGEALRPGTLVLVDEEGEYGGEGEQTEASPPPLAPLSLSGLALLGALALYAKEP